jgi:hypothetical protein
MWEGAMLDCNREQLVTLLHRWARWAECDWYAIPGQPGQGCYGTGYNNWGVQTNQKYVGALAALAVMAPDGAGLDRQWALERALAALRFSLASHCTGPSTCTDGTPWGNTWISPLGIERMMFGVRLLTPHLTEADGSALRRVLTDECEWLLLHHQRGAHKGIFGDVWNSSGKNAPESNLWDGALLWRTALLYPDHPHAADWQEQAHRFLINSVSVAADATDATVLAGKPVRERHAGANFFPHYALDHHGYLNVGYMAICHSNAALLHFDLKAAAQPRPETLDHHQADLWSVVRRMVFGDGRLARIGGDSRVRYAYCQDYLLPALMYAADRLRDAQAPALLRGLVAIVAAEAAASGDGSLYGARLGWLREQSAYYYCRLESDRVAMLGFLLAHADRVETPPLATMQLRDSHKQRIPAEAGTPTPDSSVAGHALPALLRPPATLRVAMRAGKAMQAGGAGFIGEPPAEPLEQSLAGGWHDAEHGAALHRCPTRFASFAWRAYGLTQGLCLPPGDGHLAEWSQNLAGRIRCQGDDGIQTKHRRLLSQTIRPFDGGFLTFGAVAEGLDLGIAEGWSGSIALRHQLVFAALPDKHTVIGLQHCRNGEHRAYLIEATGLLLNVPNDIFNGCRRTLTTTAGRMTLRAPATKVETRALGSKWAVVDGRLGALALYGGESLTLSRSPMRRGGKFQSLYVEEIRLGGRCRAFAAEPRATVLDVGWAVLSSVSVRGMRAFATLNAEAVVRDLPPDLRAVRVIGRDGRRYLLAFNTGATALQFSLPRGAGDFTELGGDRTWSATGEPPALGPGAAILLRATRAGS